MPIYNKLIRDKIPEIIDKDNNFYQIKQLTEKEYQQALKEKLVEEAKEVLTAHSRHSLMEEIADTYEVLDGLINSYGLSKEEIIKVQKLKAESKGKFENKTKLISVVQKKEVDRKREEETLVLDKFRGYLEQKIKPIANNLDFDSCLLKKVVQEISDHNPLLFNLRVNKQWGGLDCSRYGFYSWQINIAQYSGALAFLQTQHQSAVGMICNSDNDIVKQIYLPAIMKGNKFCGVGFSHLRRRGKPVLEAIPDGNGGYQLTGDVFWLTGYDFFDHFIVGATLPDGGELYAIAPFKNIDQKNHSIKLSQTMKLGAMEATNTVSAKLNQWYISPENIIAIKPMGNILKKDQQNLLHHGFFALGCALGSLNIIENNLNKLQLSSLSKTYQQLNLETKNLQETMLSEMENPTKTGSEKLTLRAKTINLAHRCAQGAIITSKGSANQLTHPAHRLYREAVIYSVSGQTIPVLEESFALVVN